MTSRRWTLLAAALVLLLAVGLPMLATGGVPRYVWGDVDLPGGVTLPTARGAIVWPFAGTDSSPGWVYDVALGRGVHYDALMMAGDRVESGLQDHPGTDVVVDTTAGGVPFRAFVDPYGSFSGEEDSGPELVVTFEAQPLALSPGWQQHVNLIVSLVRPEERDRLLDAFRRATWTPSERCGYCAAAGS